jgi:hypothetical protein
MQAKSSKNQEIKPQRGRPKLSDLSQTELAKLRMRKMRERKRKQGRLVPVEVWIPEYQRDVLLKNGEDLSTAAKEAFALLFRKRRY